MNILGYLKARSPPLLKINLCACWHIANAGSSEKRITLATFIVFWERIFPISVIVLISIQSTLIYDSRSYI